MSLSLLHALEYDVQKVHEVLNGFARQNPSVVTYRLIADLYGRMKLDRDAARWKEKARLGVNGS